MQKLGPYKGYTGDCEILLEEGLLYGTVQDIRAVIDYKAATIPELKEAFKDSIDAYLEMCEEIGCEPDQPYSGNVLLRTSSERHRRAAEKAAQNKVSLNSFIEAAVEEKLRASEGVVEFFERKGRPHEGYFRHIAASHVTLDKILLSSMPQNEMASAFLSRLMSTSKQESVDTFSEFHDARICDAPTERQ